MNWLLPERIGFDDTSGHAHSESPFTSAVGAQLSANKRAHPRRGKFFQKV